MPAETIGGTRKLEHLIASQHKVLGIYITFRCPLECAHCGVESHPRRAEVIDESFVLDQIDKVAAHGGIRMLHLNGGEPFLERHLLREVCRKAVELGLDVAVTTSAHWASSIARARTILAEMPALTQMMISTDIYHLPFLSLDNVRNAVEAGLEKGIVTQVAVCTPHGEADDFVVSLQEKLGEEILARVKLILFPLDPVGRADSMSEAHWREIREELPQGRCHQLNRPVLLPDGTLSACCNTLVTNKRPGSPNPLKLGNCRDRDLDELLLEADRNLYVQAIRVGGPALLARIALQHGADGQLAGRYRKGDICHLCDDVLHNQVVQKTLERALADPGVKKEIGFLRACVLGETDLLKLLPTPGTDATTTTEKETS